MPIRFPPALLCAFVLIPFTAVGEDASVKPAETRNVSPEAITQPIFQLLLGEMAIQNGQIETAARAYSDLAFRSRDLAVIKRAVELAGAARQYDLALALARQWRELEPESQEANLALINFLAVSGNIEEMEAPIGTLLAASPERAGENFLSLNRVLASHADHKAALTLLRQLARAYPDLPEAHHAVANAAAVAEEFGLARAEARQAQALKPEWIAPVLLEAQVVLRGDQATRTDDAIAILSGYLERYPDASDLRMALARILLGEKRYPEARVQFDRLLQKSPDNPDVVYPVAMLALQEKDFETARRLLQHLTTLPADRNIVHYFLGLLEEEAGNREAARQYLEQVNAGPQYLFARARLAQYLADAGKVNEARAFLHRTSVHTAREKTQLIQLEAQLLRDAGRFREAYDFIAQALKTDPEQGDLLYEAAMIAEKVGKLAEMESLLKKLIDLQPDNAHAYNALGYSLADRNLRLAEAHELIVKAVRLAPQDPFIMDSMGWVLYRQGKLEEALTVLQNAYRINADPEIAAHLGEVQWMLGRRDEAAAIWRKAASEAPENETLQAAMRKFRP
ncbi:MAG: tetratricopeptide repeat protein [Zoogloeaceae bacterium]|nr:tetratricopeptide repeat protein [Zoogloeaceae bacterium]